LSKNDLPFYKRISANFYQVCDVTFGTLKLLSFTSAYTSDHDIQFETSRSTNAPLAVLERPIRCQKQFVPRYNNPSLFTAWDYLGRKIRLALFLVPQET